MTKVKILILPKLEIGEMSGDFPGEAQFFYEHYLQGSSEFRIKGCNDRPLYYKDGIALLITGTGKMNAASSLTAVLCDERFDFSEAYLLSIGCAGTAFGRTVMGDVIVVSAVCDYDIGHHADIRELEEFSKIQEKSCENQANLDEITTWFHDSSYDEFSCKKLPETLVTKAFESAKETRLQTTVRTKSFMAKAFNNAEWAVRDPMVLRGTSISSDNYWKGLCGHRNASLIASTYGCTDPYMSAEMEEAALAGVADRFDLLDRFLSLRVSVNMDVFMNGDTPEKLWTKDYRTMDIASEDNVEACDIFETAMRNLFEVGRKVTDMLLQSDV